MQANGFICELNGKRYYLGPKADRQMTYEEASNWCASLGNNFELPSRVIMLLCYNDKALRDQFRTNDYYWISDDYKFDTALGWHQNITTGGQGTAIKTDKLFVRAVRVE